MRHRGDRERNGRFVSRRAQAVTHSANRFRYSGQPSGDSTPARNRSVAARNTTEFYANAAIGEFWTGPRPSLGTVAAQLGLATRGLGRLTGALIGAVLLVALPAVAHEIGEAAGSQRLEGNLALTFFGVVLVVVMLAAPGGLASLRIPLKKKGQ